MFLCLPIFLSAFRFTQAALTITSCGQDPIWSPSYFAPSLKHKRSITSPGNRSYSCFLKFKHFLPSELMKVLQEEQQQRQLFRCRASPWLRINTCRRGHIWLCHHSCLIIIILIWEIENKLSSAGSLPKCSQWLDLDLLNPNAGNSVQVFHVRVLYCNCSSCFIKQGNF